MDVDVTTDIEIGRPRDEVAAYACDPDNATQWYANIRRAARDSSGPLEIGSRVTFVADFLGRRLTYTYKVTDLEPGRRLVMATDEGPFTMETTYSWADTPGGGTRMSLRNRGTPSGFLRTLSPVVAAGIRRANRQDLRRLKAIRESRPTAGR